MFRPTANVKPQIESWDEDEDILANDNDLSGLRNFSTTTSTTLFSSRTTNRDSMQSQRSEHVDIVMHDGFGEDNDDWQVTVPGNDAEKAIMSAKSAGIPLPNNVPASALIGGTIKRLGAKKSWRKMVDDWSEDLEMPIGASTAAQAGLTLKPLTTEFPDAIPQDIVPSIESENQPSAGQSAGKFGTITNLSQLRGATKTLKPAAEDDDDAFGDDFEDVPTLRISKRALRPALNFGTGLDGTSTTTTQTTKPQDAFDDNMDEDFEFSGNMTSPLKLSTMREVPKTPITSGFDDMDSDWAEGSLGSTFGSKDSLAQNQPPRRSGRTDRSSSISAMSPSVFSPSLSSVTAESDEDKLDGLILPEGPLSFSKTLRPGAGLDSVPEENASISTPLETPTPRPMHKGNDDFFADIDIGEGEILNKSKATLNRNIKHKVVERTSPTRRPVTTLTFTNKPLQSQGSNESIGIGTRIPKPIERAIPRPRLEPVLERNNAFSSPIQNRHSNNSSISSIPTPTTPSQYTPSIPGTPSRRPLNNRPSQTLTRPEPTTNTAQYLRSKRSMPQLRSAQPSINTARSIPVPPVPRPPSRSERSTRSFAQSRPKTPIDRAAETNAVQNRRPPMTFLPAGAASGQSHHIATKQPSRTGFRPKSSESSDPSHSSSASHTQSSRPMSRLSSTGFRPRTPTSRRNDMAEMLAKQALNKRTLTKPTRRRAYGDGNELDAFDDLPTSASAESRYMKQPKMMGNVGGGAIRKINSNQSIGSGTATNAGKGLSGKLSSGTLASKEGQSTIPGFARDTASSRIARQERLNTYQPHLARTGHGSNDSTLTVTQWKPSTSTSTTVPATPRTLRRTAHKLPAKPHLIKPLGSAGDKARSEKGMSYNPALQRWEGNWGALTSFDVPMTPTQVPASPTPAKPALIANVGTQKGVQVVGKMVFDPIGMRWLKMRGPLPGNDRASSSGALSITTDGDDEDDPFAGLDDLVDERKVVAGVGGVEGTDEKMDLGSDDDRAVGEEFDVGPAFVKRQRQEEERWERKLVGWKGLSRTEAWVRSEREAIRRFVAAVGSESRERVEEVEL